MLLLLLFSLGCDASRAYILVKFTKNTILYTFGTPEEQAVRRNLSAGRTQDGNPVYSLQFYNLVIATNTQYRSEMSPIDPTEIMCQEDE